MFTGLVQACGRLIAREDTPSGARVRVESPLRAELGASVAVNGCCLTVVADDGDALTFDLVASTLERTTLGALPVGAAVNLEPALRAGDPLGGHIVQGHVDGVGEIVQIDQEGASRRIAVALNPELLRYCLAQGSITLNGVSLTLVWVDDAAGTAGVSLIPETIDRTTFGTAEVGDRLNVEADVLARYVERLLNHRSTPG